MEDIENLHTTILHFLAKYDDLRNNDISLQLAIIRHKYPHAVWNSKWVEYVATWALQKVTQDNVKRVRAKIQNEEGKYLPTDPKVRKARRINEEKWNEWVKKEYKYAGNAPHWNI